MDKVPSGEWVEFSVLSGDATSWILSVLVIPYWFDCDIKPNLMSWTRPMLYSSILLVVWII